MSSSLLLSEKLNKWIIWKYQSCITLLLWKCCVDLLQVQSSTPSDCFMQCPVCTVTAENKSMSFMAMSHRGVTTVKYVSTLKGILLFVERRDLIFLTPLGAQANGWTDLCLPCVGAHFQSPPSLVPGSVSSSSATLTSTSLSWLLHTSESLSMENCLSV